jgi:hypothetical protein
MNTRKFIEFVEFLEFIELKQLSPPTPSRWFHIDDGVSLSNTRCTNAVKYEIGLRDEIIRNHKSAIRNPTCE